MIIFESTDRLLVPMFSIANWIIDMKTVLVAIMQSDVVCGYIRLAAEWIKPDTLLVSSATHRCRIICASIPAITRGSRAAQDGKEHFRIGFLFTPSRVAEAMGRVQSVESNGIGEFKAVKICQHVLSRMLLASCQSMAFSEDQISRMMHST